MTHLRYTAYRWYIKCVYASYTFICMYWCYSLLNSNRYSRCTCVTTSLVLRYVQNTSVLNVIFQVHFFSSLFGGAKAKRATLLKVPQACTAHTDLRLFETFSRAVQATTKEH